MLFSSEIEEVETDRNWTDFVKEVVEQHRQARTDEEYHFME